MQTFLQSVNRVLRLGGILRGDTDPIQSFSDLAHGATLNLAILAIQSVLTDIVAYYDLPEDRKFGCIILQSGQRTYDLADDFLHFWNNPGFFYDATQNFPIKEWVGGEESLARTIWDYKTQMGYPNNFYYVDGLTKQVGFYQVPNSNITSSNAYGTMTFNNAPSGGSQATGFITFTGQPSNTNTVGINGTVVEFTSGAPTGNEVAIGISSTATAAALAYFLQNSSDSNLNQCSYTLSGLIVQVNLKEYGTVGNTATLTKSCTNISLSHSTLLGGTNSDSVNVNGTNFVFVNSLSNVTSVAGTPVVVGTSAATSANNLYNAILLNNSITGLMQVFESEGIITFLSILSGIVGYTLSTASSAIAVSGATLNGTSGRVLVYDYVRDPLPLIETDVMPFIRDIETFKFCELAAVKFNSLFTQEAKMPTQNIETDPTYISARADLLKLIRPTKLSKRYGRTYTT